MACHTTGWGYLSQVNTPLCSIYISTAQIVPPSDLRANDPSNQNYRDRKDGIGTINYFLPCCQPPVFKRLAFTVLLVVGIVLESGGLKFDDEVEIVPNPTIVVFTFDLDNCVRLHVPYAIRRSVVKVSTMSCRISVRSLLFPFPPVFFENSSITCRQVSSSELLNVRVTRERS